MAARIRGTEQPEGEFFRTDYDGLADPAGFLKPYPNAPSRAC